MTEHKARTPLWAAIARTLREEIADGNYRPGDRLPTEADLSARFGVNRHTVRHALSGLSAEGLVHSRRGAGVFVAARPVDYSLGRRVRFHQNLSAIGQIPARQVLRLETRPASPREQQALKLEEGAEVHLFEGLSLADEAPVGLFLSAFPAARFPGLTGTLAHEPSVTAALAQHGLPDYTRSETRLSAVAANAVQALHLRLREGTPLMLSVAINVDADGTPVEFGQTWFAGERVTLTVTPD